MLPWHDPARPGLIRGDLPQRYETNLGISRRDELEGLGDILALHDLRLQRVVDVERLHRLDCRPSIGRGFGIGDRDPLETAPCKRLRTGYQFIVRRIENQLANRIGEHGSLDAMTLLNEPGRSHVVSS